MVSFAKFVRYGSRVEARICFKILLIDVLKNQHSPSGSIRFYSREIVEKPRATKGEPRKMVITFRGLERKSGKLEGTGGGGDILSPFPGTSVQSMEVIQGLSNAH
jgi:hypothetical protein